MVQPIIERADYLQKLLVRRGNGEIKIITGIRRCGKSWLLKKIYHQWLIEHHIPEEHIIEISFDLDDLTSNEDLSDPVVLKQYLAERLSDTDTEYYVFLDEIQMVPGFERIVNALHARDNVDVYITGSNSKFLSNDINTIFRGRGDEIRVYPLSFKEFIFGREEEPLSQLWKEYYTFGGMPALRNYSTNEQKSSYLQRLWLKTYMDDIVEHNGIKYREVMEALVDNLCSNIGSLTNPHKIQNTLHTLQHLNIADETITSYLQCVENAFLFDAVKRFNVKGKKYYESIKKYYCVDIGLRNARLNFRQQDLPHIMENIVYNELRIRGFLVDVGIVECREQSNGKSIYKQLEVDFIATNGMDKYYIQVAYHIDDVQKEQQELASLKRIDDTFHKIIIVADDIQTYVNEQGYVFMGLFHFLQNKDFPFFV